MSKKRGTSEASTPISSWREPGFIEDASWEAAMTVIGYGDGGDDALLDDDGGRTVFDVAMDDPPGSEAAVTVTWVHMVLEVSQESVNIYINGRNGGCPPRRGGPRRRRSGCM